LEIIATQQAMDGQVSVIGVIGRDANNVDFANSPPVPSIDIEKFTNGQQADNANGADVPQVSTGGAVTWTYEVTNTGEANLTNVVVTDDTIGPITNVVSRTAGDADSVLEPAEIWTYEATGTAVEGTYENKGTVTAISDIGENVTDTDYSHYFGVTAAIDLEKSTNGVDADTPGSGPEVLVGDPVTFVYTVRNVGNVVLTNVEVTDDNGTPVDATDDFFANFSGGDDDDDSALDLNETWTFQAARLATSGQYQNMAVVTVATLGGAR